MWLTCFLSLFLYSRAQDCPLMECDTELGVGVCYRHLGGSPVTHIIFDGCVEEGHVCDFEDIAWVDPDVQFNPKI